MLRRLGQPGIGASNWPLTAGAVFGPPGCRSNNGSVSRAADRGVLVTQNGRFLDGWPRRGSHHRTLRDATAGADAGPAADCARATPRVIRRRRATDGLLAPLRKGRGVVRWITVVVFLGPTPGHINESRIKEQVGFIAWYQDFLRYFISLPVRRNAEGSMSAGRACAAAGSAQAQKVVQRRGAACGGAGQRPSLRDRYTTVWPAAAHVHANRGRAARSYFAGWSALGAVTAFTLPAASVYIHSRRKITTMQTALLPSCWRGQPSTTAVHVL